MTESSPFWKEFSFPSPVDDILKKENFTLEEILDEDDTVVDIRSQKEDLKNYFLKEEILTQLLQFIVEEPLDGCTENRKFRYPVVACEILTAEVAELDEQLVQNDGKYLKIIFGFFHKPQEQFNILLANVVVKLIASLISTHLTEVIGYLKEHPDHVFKIIDHLDCSIVTDLIVKIIACEEEYGGQGTQDWLVSIGFIKQMINKLSIEHTYLHVDLPLAISEILMRTTTGSPIYQEIMSLENITLLFDLTLQPTNPSGFRYGMNMVNQILRLVAIEQAEAEADAILPTSTPLENLSPIIQISLKNIDKFYELLKNPLGSFKITNQTGDSIDAFTVYRLVILQCLDALVHLNFEVIILEILKHEDLFICLLNLLFEFPTNNFCHKFVERIFIIVLSCLNNQPLIDFLDKLDLIKITMTKEAERKGSELYHPYIQNLAVLLQDKADSNELINTYLNKFEGWETYITKVKNDRRSTEMRNPYEVDNSTSDEEGYGSGVSGSQEEEEDLSEEPNDADDYDTENCEILLTKEDIEALG